MPTNWLHLDIERIIKETENAFLLELEDRQLWVPKSCIADTSDYEEDNINCTVSVSEWFARKEGLL